MSFAVTAGEQRLLRQQARRALVRRGMRNTAASTAADLVRATRAVRRAALQAQQPLGNRHFYAPQLRPGVIQNPRLLEHKTFDAVAAQVSSINAFATDGAVAGTPFAPVAATSAWVLNQVPIGNSSITRVGRRFANTAIALRGSVLAGSTGGASVAAMVLVWDRNPNQAAAIPAFTTVFTTQHSSSLTNKDNAPRFKILRRWVWTVVGDSDAASDRVDSSLYYFDEFVKLKNKVTLLTAADTTGLLPDMVEGALYLYLLGDAAKSTATPSMYSFQSRLYFADH